MGPRQVTQAKQCLQNRQKENDRTYWLFSGYCVILSNHKLPNVKMSNDSCLGLDINHNLSSLNMYIVCTYLFWTAFKSVLTEKVRQFFVWLFSTAAFYYNSKICLFDILKCRQQVGSKTWFSTFLSFDYLVFGDLWFDNKTQSLLCATLIPDIFRMTFMYVHISLESMASIHQFQGQYLKAKVWVLHRFQALNFQILWLVLNRWKVQRMIIG
jgi:hypothetical protein